MKETWKVDMNRLVELVAERMYSDPIKAGIRELITNSLDARMGMVEIHLDYDDIKKVLRYMDTGVGIDPATFYEIYGKLASGHERRVGSRGFFGLGRMSLIAASQNGEIMSYKDGKVYTWKFDKKGWEGPEVQDDLDQIGHGVFLYFEGIEIEELGEIEKWIQKTFSIPLAKKECVIHFQQGEVVSMIQEPTWTENQPIESKHGKITCFTKEETDGVLYVCQKGILVKEEPYTGLSAFISQDYLEIKTDREGFVNNEKYRYFRAILKENLASLRPTKSFEKMEVDFIRRLMKEFKRYWFKKMIKENHVMEKIGLKFPEPGEEIVPEQEEQVVTGSSVTASDDSTVVVPGVAEEEKPEEVPLIDQPGMEEVKKEMEQWDLIPDEPLPPPTGTLEEQVPQGTPEPQIPIKEIVPPEEKPTEIAKEEPKAEETKTVVIKGAKPVDLGEDYPMIFFEREPFVIVFNTSHPVFKELVENGKLGSAECAVLFERMFEAAWLDANPKDNLEDVRLRWKEVDKKLKEIFK